MSGFNLDIAETTAKFLDSNATVANQFQELVMKYNQLKFMYESLLVSHEKLQNELSQSRRRTHFKHSPSNDDQSSDQMVSFDNIKFTSGENTTVSDLNESLVPSTPPLPKSCTSTPVRLAANKENVMRAPKSTTKQNSKMEPIRILSDINGSSVRNEWLSKTINEGNTSTGAVRKWKTPDKLLLNDTSDLFKFPNDTETIPPSIEVLKLNKKRGNLSYVSGRLKQKRIEFPKKPSQVKKERSPKNQQPEQDDETYCEGLTQQDDDITFSEDEGFNLSSSSNKSVNIGNNNRSFATKKDESSVIAIAKQSDEVILIPDTQDIFNQVMGLGQENRVPQPVVKSSPPQQQLPLKQVTPPKQAVAIASAASAVAPARTPSRTGCEECDNWNNLMGGPAVGFGNKKKKQHVCINQRRNFGRAETPPGFWDPLIPITPEDQKKPQRYDDRLLNRKGV